MSLAPALAEQPDAKKGWIALPNGWKVVDGVYVNTPPSTDIMLHDAVDVGPKGTGNSSERPDGPGPLRLQGDHQEVSFRNIWIRPRR